MLAPTDLLGRATSDWDFFKPPPAEIGPVVGQLSTMKPTDQPSSTAKRVLFALLGYAIVGGGCGGLMSQAVSLGAATKILVPLAVGLLGLGVGLLGGMFIHTCWYIGKQGVASFIGDRETARPKVVRFAEMSALRTRETNVFVNGGYKHTKFELGLYDEKDRLMPKWEVTGTYNRDSQERPNEHHVGKALESEWSAWLFTNRVQQELAARGYVEFQGGLFGLDAVRVGHGFVEFVGKNGTDRVPKHEIASIKMQAGEMIVRRTNAKEGFFRDQGIFKFNYGDLANARVFLVMLEHLVGYSFSK